MTETSVEQHSLMQSIVLHLLPGVLIFVFYIITAPLMKGLGHPSGTALFIAIGVVLIPFELGYLLYQAKKRYDLKILNYMVTCNHIIFPAKRGISQAQLAKMV